MDERMTASEKSMEIMGQKLDLIIKMNELGARSDRGKDTRNFNPVTPLVSAETHNVTKNIGDMELTNST